MPVKLGSTVKAVMTVDGEQAVFIFRRPSNKELDEFFKAQFRTEGKQLVDVSGEARESFFDRTIQDIRDVEDETGQPVTVERKADIPTVWKRQLVFQAFETLKIDIKN